jgi:DNA-binding GntR family transcriptional regulator
MSTESRIIEKLKHAGEGDRVSWLVDILGEEIVSGELKPGQKLSEPRIAQRLGVSRPPLREAIRRLEGRHLVVRTKNQGARVASLGAEEFLQLFHVREGLEGVAARLAATHIDAQGLQTLRDLCDAQEQQLGDASAMLATDLKFHFCIAQASGSPILASLLCDDFYALFRMVRQKYPRLSGRGTRAIQQHRSIIDALAARDADLAEYVMRNHVKSAREAFAVLSRAET